MIHPINMPADFMAARDEPRPSVYGATSPAAADAPAATGRPHVRERPPQPPERMWENVFLSSFVRRLHGSVDETSAGDDATDNAPTEALNTLSFAEPVGSFAKMNQPLDLKMVDLNIRENAAAHHTGAYDVTERPRDACMVIRRGQPFKMNLATHRDIDLTSDKLHLTLEIGSLPSESKGTRVWLPVANGINVAGWLLEDVLVVKDTVRLAVTAPPSAPIGNWTMKITTSVTAADGAWTEAEYPIRNVYILFNPWCPADPTYLPDDDERAEYVLNDVGKVWRGSHNSLKPCVWSFGQFEEHVLDASLLAIDRANLKYAQRANPVQVCRAISQVVNDKDEQGILVGNWSDDFGGGTAPTAWTGSALILREFARTGRPVRFGQCWVFAGVVTTILRALGIPCRVVSNFSSAHDTDTSCTVDIHFSKSTGSPLKEYNYDSVWNFHVWNDCWMARADLPVGYGGWQAIDATPQEKSEGIYRAGPASLRAIKQGDVAFGYDTSFVFAEVNADKCYWVLDEHRCQKLARIGQDEIGRMMLTKRPGKQLLRGNDDQMDITADYKHMELSADERRAMMNALLTGHSDVLAAYRSQDLVEGDVKFELDLHETAAIGEQFHATLWIASRSRDRRTVRVSQRVQAVKYTGAGGHKVKSETAVVVVEPGETTSVVLKVSVTEYLGKLLEQANLLVSAMAHVLETDQIYTATDDFHLTLPDVDVQITSDGVVKVGRPIKLILRLINPLPIALTGCRFIVEGPGLMLTREVPCGDISSRSVGQVELTATPWRPGERTVIAHFDAAELHDIDGTLSFVVEHFF